MDIFRNADLQDLNNALGEARADEANEEKLKEEQERKDDKFNETLQSITDPIATELLRKPVEDISKKVLGKVSGAIRSRVAGGIRSAAEKGKTFAEQKLSQAADRLGISEQDLSNLRSGTLPSPRSLLDRTGSTGRATSAIPEQIDEETRGVLNRVRGVDGRPPLKAPQTDSAGEPVELDAFTGKPVVRQTEAPQPITEAGDDWTADLYDSPISHINPGSAVPKAQPSTEILAPEGATPAERSASSRLSDIFGKTDYRDVATPDFRAPPRPFQPSAAGDSEVLDQLAPMRAAMKGTQSVDTISPRQALQNRAILDKFAKSDGDLLQDQLQANPQTPQQLQLQGQQPPPEAKPASSSQEPQPTDPTQPAEAEPPTDSGTPPTTTGDSNADAAVSRTAGEDIDKAVEKTAGKTLKSVGTDALESFGESEAALGGPEDPLADVVGLVAGLGTLLGGIFGGHHTNKESTAPIVNAGVQQGVY